VLVGNGAHLSQDGVVFLQLVVVEVGHLRVAKLILTRQHGIVAQRRIFEERVDGIEPET
jgi:hypothetical protein